MKTAFEVFFALFLVSVPLSIFYWHLFRPIVLTRLKYRIYAARDELRLLGVQQKISATEKAFPILDVHCNNCLSLLSDLSLVKLLRHKSDPEIKLRAERDLEIVDGSGSELRRIKRNIHEAVVGAIFVNSPVFVFPLVLAAVALVFSYFWFNRAKRLANDFWKASWGLTYAAAGA